MSVVILHLSDLHFGAEKGNVSGLDVRDIVLRSLIDCIMTLPQEWHPEIVCISGDIGYAGKESDYAAAAEWLNQLINATSLSPNDIILCPGNHDADLDIRGIGYPPDANEADEWLSFPVPDHFQNRFAALSRFCKDFGIPPVKIKGEDNYLYGSRTHKGIRFIVLNSAWFTQGKSEGERGNLWIGRPHIISLEAEGIIKETNAGEDVPCIALIHHPREWLHASEHTPYATSNRPSTMDYLSQRCHIILTGHTHGGIRPPDRIAGAAWYVTSGAAFENAGHFNNFALLKVESHSFTLHQFEFDRRAISKPWSPKGEAKFFPFYESESPGGPEAPRYMTHGITVEDLKERAARFAEREIEKKSRAIQREGELPEPIKRSVTPYVRHERYYRDEMGRIPPKYREVKDSLHNAIARSSRTLLFAELGAGKSTLAAQLVVYLVRQQGVLSFFIPGGKLKGYLFDTVADALDSLSSFIKGQIVPERGDFHLLDLLRQRTELTLVLDGLDELSPSTARKLLERMSDLVNYWVNVRIVATGRPLELIGFNYNEWQLLELPSLDEDEMFRLLQNIALSNGCSTEDARQKAHTQLSIIRRRSELAAVVSTPLFLRLLCPRLVEDVTLKEYTLGDLLFDLLEERLITWSHREGREPLEPELEQAYPTALDRLALLGRAAKEISLAQHGVVRREALELAIQEDLKARGQPQHLAVQGVSFLVRQVLIEEDGTISFPVQPLFECALAAYHFYRLVSGNLGEPDLNIPWRVVSFMATLARRTNRVKPCREWFAGYLSRLLNESRNIPAAAYIVAEAGDRDLASHVLKQFSSLEFRPLRVFRDDRSYSAQCLARTIQLAGDEGMLWFWEQYLDPAKPVSDYIYELGGEILSYWVAMHPDDISTPIRERLLTILPAHMAVGYYASKRILASIALMLPQAFPVKQRVELFIELLWRGPLQDRARSAIFREVESGHIKEVLDALGKAARAGYESSGPAAEIWLTLKPVALPPLDILRAAIKGGYGKRANSTVAAAWSTWAGRVSRERVRALLKAWLSSEDSELACVAACVLYEMGEDGWRELAPALLRGLHDGGKVEQGEVVLRKLIVSGGEQALKWLVDQFDPEATRFDLRHSSEWRILIGCLLSMEEPRPEWLCRAVAGMNDYILSRYPEIRQGLGDLLNGRHGAVYTAALRDQLYSVDPNVRKRTACVLATVFPDSEAKALEIAIHGTYETGVLNWQAYAQRLRFGPSVLSYLRARYNEWSERARVFSLLLLYRNGIDLSESEWAQLVDGFLKGHRFVDFNLPRDVSPAHRPVLADTRAYPHLVRALLGTERKIAKAAAAELLTYHSQRLTLEERARAYLLISISSMNLSMLLKERELAAKDDEYLRTITKVSAEYGGKGEEEPALFLLIRTLEDPSAWKKVIWSSFFARDVLSPFEIEQIGELLYELAIDDPACKLGICNAAVEFLDDPRIMNPRSVHARQMLGLLGHCFGAVSDDRLRQLLLSSSSSIEGAITVCMVARLGGAVPEYTNAVERQGNEAEVNLSSESLTLSDLENRIDNALLPSEELHPDFFNLLELRLLADDLQPERLTHYYRAGHWGGWFSVLAEYYSYGTINLFRLASLTHWWRPAVDNRLEPLYRRMITVQRKLYQHIRNNAEAREKFISELRTLGTLEYGDESIRVMLLLANKAELSDMEIDSMFDQVATAEFGFEWPEFLERFVNWIVEDAENHLEIVRRAVQRGLYTLANHKPLHEEDGLARVLLPSIAWMIGESVDDLSVGVFFYGLHKILHFGYGARRHQLDDVYYLIEPIWNRIPIEVFRTTIFKGLQSEQPEVRMLCHLLAALARQNTTA
ncbi:metallophosphoesterase [Moorella sulfitireducens]|uniref:metallophosphoesterase n=1 Tax=Neomoorella sulfitireducens TaxID=2972948 RepID=UPI0021AD13A8